MINKKTKNLLKGNKMIIATLVIAIIAVSAYVYIGSSTTASYITPAVIVIDKDGVRHEIASSPIKPMQVTVGGVSNPEYVSVEWKIKATTDIPSAVTVKTKSIQGVCGNKPYWDINADWVTKPDMQKYQDAQGFWTQTIQSGVEDKIWVGGVKDWGWSWSYPHDGITGASMLHTFFENPQQPDGTYNCNWRVYGFVQAGTKTANFDSTVNVAMVYKKDAPTGVTTLSVTVTPTQINLK